MMITVLFLIALVSIAAIAGFWHSGRNHQSSGQLQTVQDHSLLSSKRDLPDAAASFLFIMVLTQGMLLRSRLRGKKD